MVMDMSRKLFTQTALLFFIGWCLYGFGVLPADARTLRVVTTLPDYAEFVKIIGGDRVTVEHVVHAVQNPHSVRPKPSFVHMVKQADVVISTGLDLELWLTTVIDKSGNRRVRSGEIGFIAVSEGMPLIEKPKVISQSEGDVHVYGNPHFTCCPLCMRRVAGNIAIGLIKNDPDSKESFLQNLKNLQDQIDKRLFGERLVKLLGGKTLARLAEQEKLIDFIGTLFDKNSAKLIRTSQVNRTRVAAQNQLVNCVINNVSVVPSSLTDFRSNVSIFEVDY